MQTLKIGADQEQVCCEIARRNPPLKPQYFTITPNGDNTVNCSLYNTVSGTVAKARTGCTCCVPCNSGCLGNSTHFLFYADFTLLVHGVLVHSERIVRRPSVSARRRQLHLLLQGYRHAAKQRCVIAFGVSWRCIFPAAGLSQVVFPWPKYFCRHYFRFRCLPNICDPVGLLARIVAVCHGCWRNPVR